MFDWIENVINNLPSSRQKRNRLLAERMAGLKQRSPSSININSLPDEMVANIFKFLPSRTINEVRRLDSRMDRIACNTKGEHFNRIHVLELKFEQWSDGFLVTIICQDDRRQFVKKYPNNFSFLILLYFWLQRVKIVGALRMEFNCRHPFQFSQLEISMIAYHKQYFKEMKELDLNKVILSDDLLKFFVNLAPKMNSLVLGNLYYFNSEDPEIIGAFGIELPRYRPPFIHDRSHRTSIIKENKSYFKQMKELAPNHVGYTDDDLLRFFDEVATIVVPPVPENLDDNHALDPKILLCRSWKNISIHHSIQPVSRNSLWTDDILLQIMPKIENFKISSTSVTREAMFKLIQIAHKTTKFWAKWEFGRVGFADIDGTREAIDAMPGVLKYFTIRKRHIWVYFKGRMSDTNCVKFDM